MGSINGQKHNPYIIGKYAHINPNDVVFTPDWLAKTHFNGRPFRCNGAGWQIEKLVSLEQKGVQFCKRSEDDLKKFLSVKYARINADKFKNSKVKALKNAKGRAKSKIAGGFVVIKNEKTGKERKEFFTTSIESMNAGIRKMHKNRIEKSLSKNEVILTQL
jgi:hypothetical protein